ncbi:RNA polymerase sigma-B factor [Actinoplanes lutulentus]|uniref:RNA polymerase sigma-B factor n=1 Tax=Actinoplanes lutulentus TaxID=1287878 RepID=A0A327Z456_9ACTN|nr:RNA polymerase sigma factor SigF [Actinoplanes lutulentus]MBB2947026.1 RNA polymerase sigma-B factor [Actinoplanes lutulentus]RAK30525.1 RNA polymerase sigma-B factor [Actinoplanes lutulentus]
MTVAVETAAVVEAPTKAVDSSASTDRASELINAMAALPAGHPSRAALRDRAIEAWLPLARHLSNRYANRGEPRDDLYQVAIVGLIKATDRFEPDRGVDFAGFAIPTIVGELKRHFRDKTWSVRVPRRLQELRLAITAANSSLSHTLGRSPTVTDIAEHLKITEDEVLEGLEGARAYNSTSLSTPVADSGTELGETLGGLDAEFEVAELRVALGPALARLDEREQKIVSLRFYGNLTQTQIAEQVGVSQMHVSRLLTRALTKLRRELDSVA